MPELADKRALLRDYALAYPRGVFVETGIYANGCSALALADLFDECHVIDVDLAQCIAVNRASERVSAYWGDSALVLPLLLAQIDRPALFWLDAHAISEDEGLPPCPLVAELEAVAAWAHGAASVVLVDDAHGLGVLPTWPSLGEVTYLAQRHWRTTVQDDVIRCLPREEGNPEQPAPPSGPLDAAGRRTR